MYDQRRKEFRANASPWADKFIASGLSEDEVKELAESHESRKKQLEHDIKPLQRVVKERETIQSDLSRKVGFGASQYEELHAARISLRNARREIIPHENALRNQRQIAYSYNKMAKAAESCDQQRELHVADKKISTPTWDLPTIEDKCEFIDLSNIIAESKTENRAIVFAGTDYGVRKMSETVAMTPQSMECHLNRYDMLFGELTTTSNPETSMQIGKSMTITAGLLNNISHTSAMLKDRQKRLQDNPTITSLLQKASEVSKAQKGFMTMDAIDATQTIRRDIRQDIRSFEWSKQQRKAKHNQQLRTKRAISKVCAAERRFVVQSHVQQAGTSSYEVI
jgi:hypothetical protein